MLKLRARSFVERAFSARMPGGERPVISGGECVCLIGVLRSSV